MLFQILNGTFVNVVAVIVGSLIGLRGASLIPERHKKLVLQAMGLITITLGVDAAVFQFNDLIATNKILMPVDAQKSYGLRLALVLIASVITGGLIGSSFRLHENIEKLGSRIHKYFDKGNKSDSSQDGSIRFAEGYLTASVIFCVGPLTFLGCLQNGADLDPSYLYIKSCMDGFTSIALAATFGWGVFASIITILVLQGSLSLLASMVSNILPAVSMGMMTAVGGIVLLATAIMILDIKKIAVADLCPGIILPPLLIYIIELIMPGMILPPS